MVRTDYLPRICRPNAVDNVFNSGRKVFEVGATPTDVPTMPIEFSVAGFRLGHSMIRAAYNWNKIFDDGFGHARLPVHVLGDRAATSAAGRGCRATGSPTSAASTTSARPAAPNLNVPAAKFNRAKAIDTHLVDPLANLRPQSFGGVRDPRAATRGATSPSAT